MSSVKRGFGPDEDKACPGAECYNLHEPAFITTDSQNGTNSTIPNCLSHWLYLNCAFLISSGGVISVFPAWTVSALLANFSFSSFSLSLSLSAYLLFTSWPLFDLHHGGRNRNGCGEPTRVRASDRVNEWRDPTQCRHQGMDHSQVAPELHPPTPPTLHSHSPVD